ncbi:glucokinase [Motilibacter peucedani]|uniref:Glucokinase n=1 Tax=Motilibacter peucedani TaxID=598650 RepID=A0A420XT88_9ACTN|nr:ROK family protein [Motilibacter peucedani]RKS80046.1 glucokinase [Motilibacter peucedani]
MVTAPLGTDGYVVAVDVGGTSLKGARTATGGEVLETVEVPTGRGADAVDQVLSLCRSLAGPRTVAVGLAVPGLVDSDRGVVRYAANLGWRDLPLRDLVADELGLPVTVEQDVRAAGRAEAALDRDGAGGSLLLVVLGTGVGATVVFDGLPVVGDTSTAGEFGHVVTRPGGLACTCGQRGCLEAYASAASIARRYHAAGGDRSATAAEIATSVDPLALQVWQEAADALGLALAGATVLLDPAAIVLAGGLSRAGSRLVDPVHRSLQQQLAWRDAPPVRLSRLGSRAGQAGAALVAWEAAAALGTGRPAGRTPAPRLRR